MNGPLELRIITQPYSEVYSGYFRRLVFGNSLTKHNKFSSFSYYVVIFFHPAFAHTALLSWEPCRFPTSDWARDICFKEFMF